MHRLALLKAETSKKLLVFILDIISVVVLYIPLYFGILYGFFNINNSYNEALIARKNIEEEHGLVLNFDNSWQEYEVAIKNFYTQYKDDIEALLPEGETYIHAYNVTVLKLPETPNETNFKNEYYSYKIDSNGQYLVHEFAEWNVVEESEQTDYYKRAMMNLFYYEYRNLNSYLKTFNSEYSLSIDTILFKESLSRLISFASSVTIFYFVLPFIFKHGATLFEKLFGLAKVDIKYGCSVSKWKLIVKPIILFALPILGFYFGGFTNIVIFVLGPMFINLICLILTRNNLDIPNLFLRIDLVVKMDSEIADTKRDIIESFKEEVEDKTFTDALSSLSTLDVLSIEEKQKSNEDKKD